MFKLNRDENTVFWSYDTGRHKELMGFELLGIPPQPVIDIYYKNVRSHFMRCPAFKSEFQNTYALRSPIDIEVEYQRGDPTKRQMNVVKPIACKPETRQYILKPRFRDSEGENAHEIFSLLIMPYLFWSNSSITMSLMNPFLEWNNPNGIRVIGGHYDIGKWKRHLEYAAELQYPNGVFKFERGDIMMYVKFTVSKNPHQKIKMTESSVTPSMRAEIQHNTHLKFTMPKCPLDMLYNIRSAYNARRK